MTFISSPQDLFKPVRTNWAFLAGIAVHLLFALSFFVVLALATTRAQAEELACNGKNLMDVMAEEQPETLAGILAEAAKVPNGNSLLWKIEKEGVSPSWLYGTMHTADPRVLELNDAAQSAYDTATTVVTELKDIANVDRKMLAMMADPEFAMLPDGATLQDLLDEEGYASVETVLESRNMPMTFASRMKPWLVFSLISIPECELVRKGQGNAVLDQMLAKRALEQGKSLVGLETVEEQISAIAGLPLDVQALLLADTAAMGPILDDVFATMTELYLDGQITTVMPLIQAMSADADTADGDSDAKAGAYAAFEKRLVETRNHTMAERLQPVLADGNAFIAVGALHLPGEEGVVQLLRDGGYTVTAVR
ncbi:TraB/GumN family protein [Hoeflea sp. TYP-13]|uniref:TraB/GumN family protein n=1 Tax=Hoeflea sp. TYP-13 TaxID=3230023 RepID=UPI0034C5EC84